MKTIIQAMLEEIYEKATKISHANKNPSCVGEKDEFYITLQQLERILKGFEE